MSSESAHREQGDTLGFGFVGASTWASRYLIPAVREVAGAQPIGIFSSSAERGRGFAQENGLEHFYASLDDMLADARVGAVYISTTNQLHAGQTLAAARAGKHVLCEKPLATSIADAEWMIRECESASVVLAVDHHLRGAPAIVAMREAIVSGSVGEVIAARVFHATSLPGELRTWRLERPEAGAGAIFDLSVHDADTIRFLLDDEVDEVAALAVNQGLATASVEDSAMAAVRMRGGALVSFHDAFTVPFAGTGIEVHGSVGSLIGRDVMSPEPIGTVSLRNADGETEIQLPGPWPLYRNAVERFVAAVRGQGRPLASGSDGLAALEVATAVATSASEGRAVRLRAP